MFLLIGTLIFVNSCEGDENNENKDEKDTVKVETEDNQTSLLKINDRLFSIPSPFQIVMLVKEINIPYNRELLNPTSNQINYSTNYKKALNLGVYGANLGYLNIYGQLPDAASYFTVVRNISKELGIMSSMNERVIKRMENNNSNKDSLTHIISRIYRDADAYLLNNNRNEIGVLIIAGGWIESLYIMTQSLQHTKDQRLIDRVGEQKHPLDNLIELLRPYYGKSTQEFDGFLENLVELATVFDGVVIKYQYIKPSVDKVNKITTINSKSKTIINEYQLKAITESIKKIRYKIIE